MKDEFWNNSSSIILERVERCKFLKTVVFLFLINFWYIDLVSCSTPLNYHKFEDLCMG